MFEWDVVKDRLWGDTNFARTFGVPLDETGAAPLASFMAAIHPEDRSPVLAAIARTVQSGCDYEAEYRVRAGEEVRWVIARGKGIRDESGRVVRFPGIILDVTRQKQAEELLRESEERFRAALDHFPSVYVLYDARRRITYINAAGVRVAGRPASDFIGRTDEEVWPEAVTSRYLPQLLRAYETKETQHFEMSMTLPSGVSYVQVVTYVPLLDSQGRIRQVLGVTRDITDRRRAEEAIQRSEARWSAAIDNFNEGAIIATEAEQVIYWNAAAQRMHGLAGAGDGIGPLKETPNTFELWTPDGKRRLELDEWPMRRIKRGEVVHDLELRLRRPDQGWEKYVAYSGTMVNTASGERLIFLSVHDLTDSKRAQEALRQSEQRLRQMADTMPQIVWVTRPDGQHEYYNRRWYEFAGRPAGSDNDEGWRGVLHPEDKAKAWAGWKRSLETGEPYEVEYRLRRHDGEYRWFLGRALAVRDAGGHIAKWFGTCTDIHDAKLAREELQKAKEAAETASKAKDHLLAVVSHELRTPLNPVLALTSYLQNKADLPQELREDIATIRRNVEQEARIVDDLLNVTRLSRGKIVLHPEAVDLHALIRTVVWQFQPQMETQEITLIVSLEAERHHVWADAGRLQQVLSNLLDNASKFTPRGGRITVGTSTPAHERIRIEVTDTGAGIDPQVLPRLFNPFEQGEKTTTRKYGGLGLGLVIVKGIMDLHGGTVTATSEGRGKGATLVVELDTVPAIVERPAAALPQDQGSTAGQRILLVEDHPDTLKTMNKLLTSLGYAVVTAGSVADAMSRIETHEFDLLVSDIGLPDGSGLDIMRELRRRTGRKGIALSGYGHEEDIRRSREAGFDEHLVKPVDFQRLDAAIRRLKC